MDQHFKRILNLVRRTGDRMVVTDPNGQDAYVVMGLDAYEALIEAQEFSADLVAEQEVQGHRATMPDAPPPEAEDDVPPEESLQEQAERDLRVWEAMRPAGTEGKTWDMTKLSEAEKREVEQAYKDLKTSRAKSVDEPPVSTNEDEPQEEQFYLEPVE